MPKRTLAQRKANPNSKYWKTKAMKSWGAIVHALYDKCAISYTGEGEECKGPLEAHHLVTRRQVVTSNDPRNGILLCSRHHKWSSILSPHNAPVSFGIWMQEHRPIQTAWVQAHRFDRLIGKANYRKRAEDLEELLNTINPRTRLGILGVLEESMERELIPQERDENND